ncbi:hypothetical protein CHS0354_038345 [Potamilus streckersoni]|uniref:Uncharacterized protein n=1 Tax=Potamilus streckersoni TaxID=2493646 RepID=A0AAE0VPI5_9BIVA|nr:hypothetical protein CHS0354_038345 [Potamilus streckersoni]
MRRSASFSSGLLPSDEQKILKKWGFIKRALIVAHIIDPLIEKGVFTPDQWISLKNKSAPEPEKTEEFLYHLLKSKPETYGIFLSTLACYGYGHVANELEGHGGNSVNRTLSDLSDRKTVGRPKGIYKIYIQDKSVQIPTGAAADGEVPDPRNGASSCFSGSASGSLSSDGINGGGDRVRVKDMIKMKEDITKELREIKEELEKQRSEDKLSLKDLERKHAELQANFQALEKSKEKLVVQFSDCQEKVENLKALLDRKQSELSKLHMENSKLNLELERRSADVRKRFEEREIERDELAKQLEKKNEEYKHLQTKLASVKSEHEDRLNRLKNVNKGKVMVEKELEAVKKEKSTLEERLKQHNSIVRELQKASDAKIEELKKTLEEERLNLEKKKTLLKQKEQECLDMEKKLLAAQKENESLKQINTNLKEKTESAEEQVKLFKMRQEFLSAPMHRHLRNTKKPVIQRVTK